MGVTLGTSAYRQALDAALTWIADNLAYFDPFHDGPAFDLKRIKRVVELAMMSSCYLAITPEAGVSPEIVRIGGLLQKTVARPAFQDLVLRRPGFLILFTDTFGCLTRLGILDRQLELSLRRALDEGFADYVDRTPHRLMDQRLSLELADLPAPLPTMEALAADSLIAAMPNPLYLDESLVYTLTHLIMFFHAYGARTDTPICRDIATLRLIWLQLIVIWTQARHWDLLLELLFCWDCAGWEPTPITNRHWTHLLQEQEPTGAFPEVDFAWRGAVSRKDEPDDDRKSQYFENHYHPTVVSVMACALRLSRLAAPNAGK